MIQWCFFFKTHTHTIFKKTTLKKIQLKASVKRQDSYGLDLFFCVFAVLQISLHWEVVRINVL